MRNAFRADTAMRLAGVIPHRTAKDAHAAAAYVLTQEGTASRQVLRQAKRHAMKAGRTTQQPSKKEPSK